MQTPWYLNPVAWSSYISTGAALFFAISPAIVNYPGVSAGLVSAIGVIGAVLVQLGYQNHSAIVRAAEIAATPTAAPPVITFTAPPAA